MLYGDFFGEAEGFIDTHKEVYMGITYHYSVNNITMLIIIIIMSSFLKPNYVVMSKPCLHPWTGCSYTAPIYIV